MFREVGKTKKKLFSAGFPARNKLSQRGNAGNQDRIPLCHYFRTQQQQRWQRNTTSQTTYKLNSKTPKTSSNYLLQHFSRTSSTRGPFKKYVRSLGGYPKSVQKRTGRGGRSCRNVRTLTI